jgi:biotin-dependent carboxylase-like uncharacterized protein
MRAYLCVAGGIDVPEVLGSRSTDLQAAIGGLDGRLLRRGDVLMISRPTPTHSAATDAAAPTHAAAPTRAAAAAIDEPSASDLPPQIGNLIRVLPGPEFDDFAAAARDVLFKASWKLTSQSNRMGYRLEGPMLARQGTDELRSHAVFPGVIQVPPNGAPIVLMSDAQATGGYPRIGCVIAADHWRLAQIAPGMSIQFEPCIRAAALSALQQQQGYLQRLQQSLRAH